MPSSGATAVPADLWPRIADLEEDDAVSAIGWDNGRAGTRGRPRQPLSRALTQPGRRSVRARGSSGTADEVASARRSGRVRGLSLIHISEPTRLGMISYAV